MNEESLWRIELADELMEVYRPREGIRMIVLGGSPSRGWSDAYSDLDIIVYWDTIDTEWLETAPLERFGGRRAAFRKMDEAGGIYLEQNYFGTLKVDVAHVTMEVWERMVDDVLLRHEASPEIQKSLGGFLESKVLHGEELAAKWKERIKLYPDELALAMIKRHMLFFQPGVLQHQALDRGDILYYYDGLCMILKNLLGILAGLNKVYFSPAEPRWLARELEGMRIKPDRMWERIRSIFESERPEAIEILEDLTAEVLDLLEERMPEIDLTRLRRRSEFEVKACREKPEVNKI